MGNVSAMTTKELHSIKDRLPRLPEAIDAMAQKIESIEAQMATLKKAGLIYAKVHVREKKYVLLVYPMANGTRPNPTYIGTDEAKIAAAKAGIARAEEYEKLKKSLDGYESLVREAARIFRTLERAFV